MSAGLASVSSPGASGLEWSLSARHIKIVTVAMTRRGVSVATLSAPTHGGSVMRPQTVSSWTNVRMASVRVKAIFVNGNVTL